MFSLQYIDAILQIENIRNSVDYLNFHSSRDVLSCYIGDENDIRRYLKDYKLNSDYTPFVEFNLEQKWQGMLEELFLQFIGTVRTKSLINHIDWTGLSIDDKNEWLTEYEQIYDVSTYLYKILWEKEE